MQTDLTDKINRMLQPPNSANGSLSPTMPMYCQTEGQLSRRQETDRMSYEKLTQFDTNNKQYYRRSD